MHKHRVKTYQDRAFFGPVRHPEKPAAHGNITRIASCACGAVRRTNINGSHREVGQWEAK